MSKVYIGVDNGVTGTISVIDKKGEIYHFPVPTFKELSYTKKKQYISRIDTEKLSNEFRTIITRLVRSRKTNPLLFCLLERPMINPLRFKASMSALRALEATLIVLKSFKIPMQYIDSKQWQKELLPTGILKLKSKDKSKELKRAAVDIAKRLFPSIETNDADSLLIAEYARRKRL